MLRWFSNLKIAHKLTLGFGLVLLLMLGTLAIDMVASTAQTAEADRLVDHLYPARQVAREIVALAYARPCVPCGRTYASWQLCAVRSRR